ncbi:unnamed protein product [Paramecium octaurelia]|uniref:Uncharacterized protein n=1 Tax=Paramecium octaurelia TaxID=43137 RepID=A0A8S1X909_PAROT|nr:unnamed protein product [Paramecium octaurelia]
MKQRPRQIDASKPVLTISTLEAFNNAEGQEPEIKNTEQIITPDQLMKEKQIAYICLITKEEFKIEEFTFLKCEISTLLLHTCLIYFYIILIIIQTQII